MAPYLFIYLFTGAMHINKHKCKHARISPKSYFSSVDPWPLRMLKGHPENRDRALNTYTSYEKKRFTHNQINYY